MQIHDPTERRPNLIILAIATDGCIEESTTTLSAVAQNPGTTTLELVDVLCPGSVCTVLKVEIWIFRDGAHLSVPGSLMLSDKFEAVIRKQVRT